MNTTVTGYQPRRATRSSDRRLLGGVAAGLAEHLGLPVLWVRVAFVLATVLSGLGVVLYGALWLIMPSAAHLERSAPGLEAASRSGLRPHRGRRRGEVGPLVALGAVAVGVVVLAQSLLGGSGLFWPVLLFVAGLAVLWRQADEAQRERWLDSTGRIDLVRAVVGRGTVASYTRLAAGLALLAFALVLFAVLTGRSGVAGEVLIAGAVGVVGLALTIGPWLFRLVGDLAEERAVRVRTQERADVAAHLHDSVLQTLALIQKHADDGKTVAQLARAQERDLRSWLYDDVSAADSSLVSSLRSAAAEVEDAHGVPVEVVTVGDAVLSRELQPLVLAAREAMVNAAKHSGAGKVDVYAEAGDGQVEVFVRDRGAGFDLSVVPADRLGVRNSIVERMRRHGGTARVRTAPGEGTEVALTMETGKGE
jgi:signal transduction histidine kinase/phage shock protein PspC (stress-responsive transcriptional regulator)